MSLLGKIVRWSKRSPLYLPRKRYAVVDDRDPRNEGRVLIQSTKDSTRVLWVHPTHLEAVVTDRGLARLASRFAARSRERHGHVCPVCSKSYECSGTERVAYECESLYRRCNEHAKVAK